MHTTSLPSELKNPHPAAEPRRDTLARFYTKETVFQLFMLCAFPLHLWTLLMAFRDFGWVALRTNVWDAVGLVSYALVVALVETLLVFVAAMLLGFLIPRQWETRKRLAVLGFLVFLLSAWSIILKVYALYGSPLPADLIPLLVTVGHPLRLLWISSFLLVLVSVVGPLIWIGRSPRLIQAVIDFFDRLVILSSFYLILDVAAILMIVLRNLLARAAVI